MSPLRRKTRFPRTRSGRYKLGLLDAERDLLVDLCGQLRDVLTGTQPDEELVRRLFPPGSAVDAQVTREYRELMHDDLLALRLARLDTIEDAARRSDVDQDELEALAGAVNDIRLVLGTRLDVSEEDDLDFSDDDPDAATRAIYYHLGYLMEELVDALTR
jgi:hypothetical protein